MTYEITDDDGSNLEALEINIIFVVLDLTGLIHDYSCISDRFAYTPYIGLHWRVFNLQFEAKQEPK